jgi:hypothetical protein
MRYPHTTLFSRQGNVDSKNDDIEMMITVIIVIMIVVMMMISLVVIVTCVIVIIPVMKMTATVMIVAVMILLICAIMIMMIKLYDGDDCGLTTVIVISNVIIAIVCLYSVSLITYVSPRESKGVAGPFTVNDLREKYELDEIDSRTLIWKGGNESWHQLRHMPNLYPMVQPMPKIPERSIESNIMSMVALQNDLDSSLVRGQKHPLVISLSRVCKKCGAFATVYTPGSGEQLPITTVSSIATCLPLKGTSEMIPGKYIYVYIYIYFEVFIYI